MGTNKTMVMNKTMRTNKIVGTNKTIGTNKSMRTNKRYGDEHPETYERTHALNPLGYLELIIKK